MSSHSIAFFAFYWTILVLVGATCNNGIIESGVSLKQIQEAVDKHNDLRLLIAHGQLEGQPRGVDLKRMEWDDKLAKAAQDIANTCEFQHVRVTDERFQVGQNLYWSASTAARNGSNWSTGIQAWFDEYKDYHYPDGPSSKTGHYTQVVWADTMYVGCGYTQYLTDDNWYAKLYVCNYGPAGNYVGEAPYKTGDKGCDDLC